MLNSKFTKSGRIVIQKSSEFFTPTQITKEQTMHGHYTSNHFISSMC